MKKKMLLLLVLALLPAMLFSACSSSSDGAAGSSVISFKGGENTGTAGYGGYGGGLDIETYTMNGVTISRSGSADASFTVPSDALLPVDSFGTTTVIVDVDTVVLLYPSTGITGTLPAAGVLYMIDGVANLYVSNGDGGDVVTGLKVNEGVTLTLPLNFDTDNWDNDSGYGGYGGYNDSGQDTASLEFGSDVVINGTVKTMDLTTATTSTWGFGIADQRSFGTATATARDMGSLMITAGYASASGGGIIIGPYGSVITKGLDGAAAGERGGDGGKVTLDGFIYVVNQGTIDTSGGNGFEGSNGGNASVSSSEDVSPWNLQSELYAGLSFVNMGTINANGGSGANGGYASALLLVVQGPFTYMDPNHFRTQLYNTGAITANGGEGRDGSGGDAASGILLESRVGDVFNSGSITANGGNGTGSGGAGCGWRESSVSLTAGNYNSTSGMVYNSGAITANGGTSSVSGEGGEGGYFRISANGEIRNNAALTLNGGAGSDGNNGGNGGGINIYGSVPYNYLTSEYSPVQPITISGNISANGGAAVDGGAAGAGGGMFIAQENDGGWVYGEWNYNTDQVIAPASGGGISLLGYASADLSAGNGVTAGGAALWDFTVHTRQTYAYNYNSNTNDYDATALPAGPITNEIDIAIKGGKASAAGGIGGFGGSVVLSALDASDTGGNIYPYTGGAAVATGGISVVTNSGNIDISGGSGDGGGGGADYVSITAFSAVNNSGNITAKGGDSASSWAGNGAIGSANVYYNFSTWRYHYGIDIYSRGDVVNTGTVDVSGGSGENGYLGGEIHVMAEGSVSTPGSLIAVGGNGAAVNGDGGFVVIDQATQWGTISADAGAGAGDQGTDGDVYINIGDPGNPLIE